MRSSVVVAISGLVALAGVVFSSSDFAAKGRVDCRLVLCAEPQCSNPIPANPPKGKCCPICPNVCLYNGNTYQVGDTFPAGDGCNTCTCSVVGNGVTGVMCTEIACQACKFNGEVYQVGDSFPAGDGCNTCTCTGPDQVACTEIACAAALPASPPAPPQTLVCPALRPGSFGICVNLCSGDDSCPAGQKCCSNGCGRVCKIAVTDAVSAKFNVGVCKFNGKVFVVGESFPAGDGCNTCGCIAPDRVVCTLISCAQSAPPQSTCPPHKPRVYCLIDPCRFAECPAHPDAQCVSDYCGGCNAKFFEDKDEVTDTCQCPVKGQVFTECGSACPPNCTDPTPICTRQCVPRCQCPSGTVINEVTNECVPVEECPSKSHTMVQSVPSTCPPEKPRVSCFVNPCKITNLVCQPNARCVADYCGGCNAKFFDQQGNEVTDSCIELYD